MVQPSPKPGKEKVTPALLAYLVANNNPDVVRTTVDLIIERSKVGEAHYGRPLETFNGRDSLQDAWEEAADCSQYLQQLCMEEPSPLAHAARQHAVEMLMLLTKMRATRRREGLA